MKRQDFNAGASNFIKREEKKFCNEKKKNTKCTLV